MERVREYLRYIGVEQGREPNLDFLRELHSQHLLTVSFENWDIHTHREIVVNEEAFIDKILRRNRGGFCYELNGAFAWLLEQLGFSVSRLSARVTRDSGGFGPEFDHLTLLVDVGDGYIADVGFGASSLYPLPLSGDPVTDTLASYCIGKTNDGLYLYRTLENGEWATSYIFTLGPHPLSAFSEMCLYHQTSPDSPFPKGTVCTKATKFGRITIRGNTLVEATKEGKSERIITDEEREKLLKELFNVDIRK